MARPSNRAGFKLITEKSVKTNQLTKCMSIIVYVKSRDYEVGGI